jgi:hypothetical protein
VLQPQGEQSPACVVLRSVYNRPVSHAAHARHRLGAYEVTGALGAGGTGEVYRARGSRLNRTVPFKVRCCDVGVTRSSWPVRSI